MDDWVRVHGHFTVDDCEKIDLKYECGFIEEEVNTMVKGNKRVFPAFIKYWRPSKKEEVKMPTVDNVNNWFHARKDVPFEHNIAYVGKSSDKFPIIGAIIYRNMTSPAVWDFSGICKLCTDMPIPRVYFNLLPIDREQAWLAEELADLWKYIDAEYGWCTISQDKHPMFWSTRPYFDKKMNAWWKTNSTQKVFTCLPVKIETCLPIEMTLQERPVED